MAVEHQGSYTSKQRLSLAFDLKELGALIAKDSDVANNREEQGEITSWILT